MRMRSKNKTGKKYRFKNLLIDEVSGDEALHLLVYELRA
jgi:hypothetical protein